MSLFNDGSSLYLYLIFNFIFMKSKPNFILQNHKNNELERIISIPIYKNDTYAEIVWRFVKEFNDDSIQDGLFIVNEEMKKK